MRYVNVLSPPTFVFSPIFPQYINPATLSPYYNWRPISSGLSLTTLEGGTGRTFIFLEMASFSSTRSRISSIILLYLFLCVFYAEISVCYSAKVNHNIILNVFIYLFLFFVNYSFGCIFSDTQLFLVAQILGFFALNFFISLKIGWVSRCM